jgi:hypothetical protein
MKCSISQEINATIFLKKKAQIGIQALRMNPFNGTLFV